MTKKGVAPDAVKDTLIRVLDERPTECMAVMEMGIGGEERGREHLERAVTIFEELGAKRDLARACLRE